MAEIGYGRTREQICNTVKSILDKDGRPNPFKKNKPGRGQGAARGLPRTGRLVDSDSSSSYESSSPDKNDYQCPVCSFPENGIDPWIACDTCNHWFHIHCTSVDLDCNFDELEWECYDCSFS